MGSQVAVYGHPGIGMPDYVRFIEQELSNWQMPLKQSMYNQNSQKDCIGN